MRKRAVSRGEVARRAGVSGAAVSYAMSDKKDYRISKETRERILKIAEELGYKPFFPGKTLSTGKSFNIGLLLPSEHMLASQHIMAVIRGIAEKSAKTDYNLTLFYRNELSKCADSVESKRVDGLFVLGGSAGIVRDRSFADIPLTLVDGEEDVQDRKNAASARSDHEGMFEEAFQYFISKGCGSLLGVLGMSRGKPGIETSAFFSACSRHADKIFGSMLAPDGNFTTQAERMLASGGRKWDAFIVDNECLANLLSDALEKAGLREGADYHMVVYTKSNQRFSCNTHRDKIKCSRVCFEQEFELGGAAWNLMAKLIDCGGPLEKVLIPYKLSIKGEKPSPCFWNSNWK